MTKQLTPGPSPVGIFPDMAPRHAQPGSPQIRIEVRENAHAYTLHAEMPGVLKEDIQVTLEADTVLLRAEIRPHPPLLGGERVLHSERSLGSITRSLQLAHPIDAERAHARYEQGVLTLSLPKRHLMGGQAIAIE
jgi:HSP20 family protein